MENLRNYIKGLNLCIAAGVDVRTIILEQSVPVIRTIEINESAKSLAVWYLQDGRDRQWHLPIIAKFTTEFDDLPDEILDWGV